MRWLAPEAGQRGHIESSLRGCLVSHYCLSTCPSLSRVNIPALLTSHCSSTVELGLPQARKKLGCEINRQPRPKVVSEWDGDSHFWHLHRQHIGNGPDL